LWPDSNHSTALAFSAPGYWIWTTDRTDGEGYDPENEVYSIDGTSPACAFAAGVAALVFSMNTSFTPAQVEEILYQSCMDIGAPGHDEEFGWGLVNAHKAVQAAEPDITWIDFSFAGPNVGTFFYPYDTLADAVNAAPAGRTVRMKPSSSTETITITQSITLEAWNGPVTIGG
jgi:hypothetical protein